MVVSKRQDSIKTGLSGSEGIDGETQMTIKRLKQQELEIVWRSRKEDGSDDYWTLRLGPDRRDTRNIDEMNTGGDLKKRNLTGVCVLVSIPEEMNRTHTPLESGERLGPERGILKSARKRCWLKPCLPSHPESTTRLAFLIMPLSYACPQIPPGSSIAIARLSGKKAVCGVNHRGRSWAIEWNYGIFGSGNVESASHLMRVVW